MSSIKIDTSFRREKLSSLVNRGKSFLKRYAKNRGAVVGTIIFLFFALLAVLANYVSPYDPYKMNLLSGEIFLPPSESHILGTDKFGRDVLSRLIWGTRVSLFLGFVSASISALIGVSLGATAGYFGGKFDELLMRIVDIFLTLPTFFLILLIAAIFGGSMWNVITIIGLTIWPGTARLIRAQFLSLKEREFVEAARASGAGDTHIIFRQILPNAIFPAIVNMSLQIGSAILTEAGLSFLGLGDPNVVSWGWMLNDALQGFRRAWWLPTAPGVAITLAVVSFNLIGDGLNDALNPRLKER